ncbi:Histone-lysine N-methyltransferase ATX4 [Porphyridium purpureum]|uniref:Histone-lysine N-methyltransferase ATX4 n=1 Tax=Porphyridium purpureum TaxID=35688 RepID=A0A5J4YIT9_PORPP|nr:Histone-lysine N-methyltransferase ATX4 [Porphyridium purpureum]|eukprot:POR9469..scf270_19
MNIDTGPGTNHFGQENIGKSPTQAYRRLYWGKCIGEYPGERLTRDAANRQGDHVYLFDIDGDVIDDRPGSGFADENQLRFLSNRCQRPNVYAESIFLSETRASIFFFAAHNIEAGEELTLTYGGNDLLPNCVCQDCRPI